MSVDSREAEAVVRQMRRSLQTAFSPETAIGDAHVRHDVPSAGHCAAVALIVQAVLGGELVSTEVDDFSHWFNRLSTTGGSLDVDLTGDQFGLAPVRLGAPDTLFSRARIRPLNSVLDETIARAARLARRADLSNAVLILDGELHRRAISGALSVPSRASFTAS